MYYAKEPYIDTQFINSFTFEKFNMIKKGITKNDDIEIIGQSFERNTTGSATYKIAQDRNAIEISPPDLTQECWS